MRKILVTIAATALISVGNTSPSQAFKMPDPHCDWIYPNCTPSPFPIPPNHCDPAPCHIKKHHKAKVRKPITNGIVIAS